MEILTAVMEAISPLKAWRKAANKNTEDAAREAGVTPAMWSRWENERRQVPAERVLDLERITGVSRHDLRPDVFGPSKRQPERARA